MSEYPAREGATLDSQSGHVSVPLVIVAALLCGLGLLGIFYWLYTFNFLYFPSILVLAGGAYLLFTRASGPDHA